MTLEALHSDFNEAVNKIMQNSSVRSGRTREFGDFVLSTEEAGRTLVHAITDNSDKKNVVRVSHEVTPPNYRGSFSVAVNGQPTSDDVTVAKALYERIKATPRAANSARPVASAA